jgi:SAM-dependent methyltransferase
MRERGMDRSLGSVFDSYAALYDEVRPSYPERAIEEILNAALGDDHVGRRLRVLEIGPGTGQATALFVRRGLEIHCVEPGEELLGRLRGKFGELPHVHLHHATFEAWPLPDASFDIVVAAQSWHWIDPSIGYAKVVAALRHSGVIALLWNSLRYRGSEMEAGLERVRADAYGHEYAPERWNGLIVERYGEVKRDLEASGLFCDVSIVTHRWEIEYSAEQYCRLQESYSDVASLDIPAKVRLLGRMREVIEQAGGTGLFEYETCLVLGRCEGEGGER